MTEITKFLNNKRLQRSQALVSSGEDGLFIHSIKSLFRSGCYDMLCFCFCDLFIRCTTRAGSRSEAEMQRQYLTALDSYNLLWLAVLAGLYASCWSLIAYSPAPHVILAVACTVGLVRFIELWSVMAQLHTSGTYTPAWVGRSVVHALIHYWEFVLFFAILFLVVAWSGDSFGDDGEEAVAASGFTKRVMTPVYFSFVTITTLGYGDYSPQTDLGEALVIVEVMSGLLLTLIVFQRILSARKERGANSGTGADPS